jgi:hypothetical protein
LLGYTMGHTLTRCGRSFVGGVKLSLALAELGLIDEYKFVVTTHFLTTSEVP